MVRLVMCGIDKLKYGFLEDVKTEDESPDNVIKHLKEFEEVLITSNNKHVNIFPKYKTF